MDDKKTALDWLTEDLEALRTTPPGTVKWNRILVYALLNPEIIRPQVKQLLALFEKRLDHD